MFLHSTKVNGDEIPRLLRNSELVAYHRFRGSKELRVNHPSFKPEAENTNLIASRLNSDTKSRTNSGLCNLFHIVVGIPSTRKNLQCRGVVRISDGIT